MIKFELPVPTIDKLTITSLIDDYSGYNSPFYSQHGLSLLLEVKIGQVKKQILFDTGQSATPLLKNMERLKIDPNIIDMIVISHSHFDHTGGLVGVLKKIDREIPVIAHPDVFRANYIFSPYLRNIGIDNKNNRPNVIANGGQLVLVKEPIPLMDGVFTTGEVDRSYAPFENEDHQIYNLSDGKFVPNNVIDDLSLIINLKEKGLVIIGGCSHAGIINIVEHSRQITGVKNVYSVIGGLHLVGASNDRISKTVKQLIELNTKLIYAGHCTGSKAQAAFSKAFSFSSEPLHSGKKIIL